MSQAPTNQDPAHIADLECALLSIILLEPTAIARASALTAADFVDDRHGLIFETVLDLLRRGPMHEPWDVVAALRATDALDRAGGEAYINAVVIHPGLDPRRLDWLVEQVGTAAARRRAAKAFSGLARMVEHPGEDLDEMAATARTALAGLATAGGRDPFPRLGAVADELIASFEPGNIDPGVQTRIPALDALLGGGMKPGQLVVLAGQTSSGKSAIALQIALHAAFAASLAGDAAPPPRGVLYISFEMLMKELYLRLVHQVCETSAPFRPEQKGWLPVDRPIAIAGVHVIARLPLVVLDKQARTVEAVRGAVEQYAILIGPPALVVVDHIGLMVAPRITNRVEAVGHITRSLKAMALENEIPVLALAQLNREAGKRDNKRPVLSDLRESGSVEQDGDVVIFLHRDSYHADPAERARLESGPVAGELIVAKNRAGHVGTADITWHGRRFLTWPADGTTAPIGLLEPPVARAAPTVAPDPDMDRAVAIVVDIGGWVTRPAFNGRAGISTAAWGNDRLQKGLDRAVNAGRVEREGEGRGQAARYRAVASGGHGGTEIAPEGALLRLLPDPTGPVTDDADEDLFR